MFSPCSPYGSRIKICNHKRELQAGWKTCVVRENVVGCRSMPASPFYFLTRPAHRWSNPWVARSDAVTYPANSSVLWYVALQWHIVQWISNFVHLKLKIMPLFSFFSNKITHMLCWKNIPSIIAVSDKKNSLGSLVDSVLGSLKIVNWTTIRLFMLIRYINIISLWMVHKTLTFKWQLIALLHYLHT